MHISRSNPQPAFNAPHTERRARWISLAEFLLGALVILGDNVWRVLPNSVFLLAAMALLSIRLREGSWSAIGLRLARPWRCLGIAVAAVVAQQALGQFVVDPLTKPYLRYAAGANPMMGAHGLGLVRWLAVIWTYAAFGEELAYRRFLLRRVAHAAGNSRLAVALGLLASSALFGCAHWYQGPAGVVSASVSGLLFGAAYLLAGNLWTPICAHGLSDSLALFATYFKLGG
ncbi:MAG TPA: type II CAAX endopeptidase family protein [Bryobacteraceae bacterium]|nr:type II CAAX endopeptidase family protein [Bryobacteraceae bacterium]